MPRARSSWIVASLLLACSTAAPTSSQPAPGSDPVAPGLRMPPAEAFVALADPSYGYASFCAGAPSQGEQAPDFELPTHTGETLRLHDALADGPVLLMVYRGFW